MRWPQRTEAERFWAKVDKGGANGCWLWTAYRDYRNYGQFALTSSNKRVRAHRYAYEAVVGPIPDGLELDHLCRNPPCVNPAHLEPVTHHENVLRGQTLAAVYARRTHCHAGHPFDEKNTRIARAEGGRRVCRECRKVQRRARRSAEAKDGPS